jgi:L-2-hydroxyglutarate oxidase LhgO
MTDIAVTVIGGGVVGCAVADAAARAGLGTVLLEREPALARATTSRNSEVMHGGMYYPPDSLKARFCVQGRRLARAFAAEHGVGYRECGKLIVAVDPAEVPALRELCARGRENGVEDLQLLDTDALRRLEPDVRAVAALHSPRTAICDAEGLARALARRAGEHGAQVMLAAPVHGLTPETGGWRVEVGAAERREGWSHRSRCVVIAAGLHSDRLARAAGIDVDARGWRQVLVKGNYFGVDPRHRGRVRHLVYPLPPADVAALGVHLCLDLADGMRLGPDSEAPLPAGADPDAVSWAVDPGRGEAFWRGANRYLPWLAPEDLTPAMSGLRPKLSAGSFRDFVVDVGADGLEGLVTLAGIDSPGLTAAMAIGEHVAQTLAGW